MADRTFSIAIMVDSVGVEALVDWINNKMSPADFADTAFALGTGDARAMIVAAVAAHEASEAAYAAERIARAAAPVDEEIDSPAETLGAGTFASRIAEYQRAEAAALAYESQPASDDADADDFDQPAPVDGAVFYIGEERFEISSVVTDGDGVRYVHTVGGGVLPFVIRRNGTVYHAKLGTLDAATGTAIIAGADRFDRERIAERANRDAKAAAILATIDAINAYDIAEFVTDYSAPADSVFELRAAEVEALNAVNEADAELDEAARRTDSASYEYALNAKHNAFNVYYARRLAREAVAPNPIALIHKFGRKYFVVRVTDDGLHTVRLHATPFTRQDDARAFARNAGYTGAAVIDMRGE